jgi:hypothetical protein
MIRVSQTKVSSREIWHFSIFWAVEAPVVHILVLQESRDEPPDRNLCAGFANHGLDGSVKMLE